MIVNEIFYSLQGEGGRTGCPTIFVRLSGCNLSCKWCDTDHKEGKVMSAESIMREVGKHDCQWVCITGGEPYCQEHDLTRLIVLLQNSFYNVQIETNGTLISQPKNGDAPDMVTVSPKGNTRVNWDILKDLSYRAEIEYKVVVTEKGPECNILKLKEFASGDPIYLQPVSCNQEATKKCIQIIQQQGLENIRLSVQVHKIVGMR